MPECHDSWTQPETAERGYWRTEQPTREGLQAGDRDTLTELADRSSDVRLGPLTDGLERGLAAGSIRQRNTVVLRRET